MIRDRIVVSLKDASLSEKLQPDSELTLEKAILKATQSEMVKKQQQELRSQFQEVTEKATSLQMIPAADPDLPSGGCAVRASTN